MQRQLAFVIQDSGKPLVHRLIIRNVGNCRGRESDHRRSDHGPEFHARYPFRNLRCGVVWRHSLTMGKCGCADRKNFVRRNDQYSRVKAISFERGVLTDIHFRVGGGSLLRLVDRT